MFKHSQHFNVIASLLLLGAFSAACSTLKGTNSADDGDRYADPAVDAARVVPVAAPAALPDEAPAPPQEKDEKSKLLQEKNRLLVERYLENAKSLKERLKYEEAEEQLVEALNLDPGNAEVLAALNEIQALLGKKPGAIADIKKMASERFEVRKQQLKHKAVETFQKGKVLMERKEYDRAITYFEDVLNQIKWSAYAVDWGTLEADAKAQLQEAKRLREVQAQEKKRQQEREAFEKLKKEEEAQRAQRDYQVGILLNGAIDKFMRQDFGGAEELVEQVLKIAPNNDKAAELLDNIEEARRSENARQYISRKREAFLQWKEEIEKTRIPYFGILTPTDEEEWARITRMRSSIKNLGLEAFETPQDRALRNRLKTTRSDFNFEEDEITTVANVIHNFTGIPVVVNGEVKSELEDNAQTISLMDLKNISVESLLNLICEQVGEGLTWTVRKGVVLITKQEKLLENIQIRIHPIKDITFGLTTFRGPVIGQITPPDQTGEDAETSIFGGELEKETPIPPEDVLNLIQENIAPESWDQDMFSADITADQGSILVIHTPEVQKQVADFLDDLRRFSSTQVTIESRFIELNDDFIQEISADWRGLGNDGKAPNPIMDVTNGFEDNASAGLDNQGDGGAGASPSAGIFYNDNSDGDIRFRNEGVWGSGLGNVLSTIGGGAFQFSLIDDTMFNLVVRAVEKSYNATEITTPIITAFNTQRSYITVINQVSYVQGFDVDVATSSFIANPNIGVIQEGIVLDVRPTVSYDRKYITLEIQTTVADLRRPMRTRATSLGGQTTPVTFQLPELQVSSASTTVVVPDGGSIILGGLKKLRYLNRKAETPVLSKIPIVGFFFRNKGLSDEVMNLIILARAYITDMNEIRQATDLQGGAIAGASLPGTAGG